MQLAFPIKKVVEGEYVVFNFEAQGESIKKINDKLRLEQEELLRYLITKARPQKISKKGKAQEVAEEVRETKKEKPKVKVKTVTAKAKPVKAVKSTKTTKTKKETKKGKKK